MQFYRILLIFLMFIISSTKEIPRGFCGSGKSETGYIPVSDNQKYFYWFFESRNDVSNDPLFIWLTGGPGCSSMLALFLENGPCYLQGDTSRTLQARYSWNNQASVIYIDQPSDVGFSTGPSSERNEQILRNHVFIFLQKFFQSKPELLKNDFYVVGESYAGHYVPNVVKAILDGNKQKDGSFFKINLKGLAIGNGMINPLIQYEKFCNYSLQNKYRKLVNLEDSRRTMDNIWPLCKRSIEQCMATRTNDSCLRSESVCSYMLHQCSKNLQLNNWNIYNVHQSCDAPVTCYDFSSINEYLNQRDIQDILGVEKKHWNVCNRKVFSNFKQDFMNDYSYLITEALNLGIRVLIYAGEADYICNWMGNDEWTRKLQWHKSSLFSVAPLLPWSGSGQSDSPIGELRHVGGLSFVKVYNAGHMVPMDQPRNALLLINSFFQNTINYD